MRLHKNIIQIILPGAIMFSVVSCTESQNVFPEENTEGKEIEFDLDFSSRATNPDLLEDFSDYFEADKSCVLISQRSQSVAFDFSPESSNCYTYKYYENGDANWDSGYNFTSENPLSWDQIQKNGQYGNGFAFGALFFPRDYIYAEKVRDDQSDVDAFYESDILGAWHKTTKDLDRLRFRLNHLMCKLQVNLYIPVYDEVKGDGFIHDDVRATTINLRTDYQIDWGDRISELPPIAKPDPTIVGERKNIIMYKKEVKDNIIELENLDRFNVLDMDKDIVKQYTFEVMFPEQTVNGDFLRFILKNGERETNYVFNSAYLTYNSLGFALQAGAVTELNLYLPRTDNNILVLSAFVHKWNKAQTSFTITPETTE